MSIRSALVLVAVSALTFSALAAPVTAAGDGDRVSRVVLTDPAGDVWTIGEGEAEEWVPAGDATDADVRRAVVIHRGRSVVVRMTFTNLRREHPAFYAAAIHNPEKFRAAFVWAGPGRWKGQHVLVNGRFGTVRCRGFRHTIDYADDLVTMRVPRRCLGRPAWVRASLENYSSRGESEETLRELTDNPHNDGQESGITRRLYQAG